MTSAARSPRAGRQATLTVEGRKEGDRILLRAHGELVVGCTDTLAGTLAALPADAARIELDVSGVSLMDTAGLRFLDLLSGYGRRHGIPVSATGWRGQPHRVLELLDLDTTDPLRTALPRASAVRTASAVVQERAEEVESLRLEIEQLRHAIDSRPLIDQARGILMAAHACTSDQAWDILREASQRTNLKLRQVAAAVTASAVPEGPAPPGPLRAALRAAAARHAR
ncbi:hypothetical protein GCM10010503_13590 [Streptomyces lucensis JCM 4490]|uniref:ANTAR domain-containing protein n=1 Tax=Streptomyces lucensis JCM 4490 TaxID=1306176 RepID=A0A918MLR3_9ACTN|nr:ANTAR domain-containing protein [Streptomyces lucensis]GGW38688.1 hypothetical protein GCM10010503_13590 [Streptomyces lucensis JCM 4490]